MLNLKQQALISFITMFIVASINVYANEEIVRSDISKSMSTSPLSIKERAELWDIAEEDYIKYTQIMEGPLRYWNPDIDPVLALGIFADSEADKNHFAEIYAQQEYQLTQKTLAFERRYRSAFNRLYPNADIISAALMAPYHAHQMNNRSGKKDNHSPFSNRLLEGDRILYFVDGNCKNCQGEVDHLQQLVRNNPMLFIDFYITHITHEREARSWATQHAINIDLVKTARVTINVDDGAHQKLRASANHDTEFFLHRRGEIYAVSRADIFLQ